MGHCWLQKKKKRIDRGKESVKSSLAKLVGLALENSFPAVVVRRYGEKTFRGWRWPRQGSGGGGIIFGLGLFKSAEETRRKDGGGGGGWGGRGNESNELPRQIFSASLLSQRNRLRCDFVVVARDHADAQSFSRAPFSNSTYQSATFPSPSVNFMNTRSFLSLSLSFLSSLRESRFVEFSIRRESHCAYLLAVLLIDGLVAEREEVEKMRER